MILKYPFPTTTYMYKARLQKIYHNRLPAEAEESLAVLHEARYPRATLLAITRCTFVGNLAPTHPQMTCFWGFNVLKVSPGHKALLKNKQNKMKQKERERERNEIFKRFEKIVKKYCILIKLFVLEL